MNLLPGSETVLAGQLSLPLNWHKQNTSPPDLLDMIGVLVSQGQVPKREKLLCRMEGEQFYCITLGVILLEWYKIGNVFSLISSFVND